MLWWCAAQTAAWDWSWRAYPGVWLFMLVAVVTFVVLSRNDGVAGAAGRGSRALPILGLLLMWLALDWPVGTLGGGYLASLHAVQFLILAMIAPPLLLLGLPRLVERFTPHPLVALAIFGVIIFATHLPVVSDALMRRQAGAFLIDLLWLGGGVLYWWPVVGRTERPSFPAPLRMAYLFALMVLMTGPGAMITFADVPLFSVYELAPRVHGVPALDDQRVAGLLMKVGGAVILWTAISILFYRWHREENRLLEEDLAAVTERSSAPAR